VKAGDKPAFLFATEEAMEMDRARDVIERARSRGVCVRVVSDDVMKVMSDTVTPSGLLAVVPMPSGAVQGTPTLVLIVDQLRDPGNMGTMLRSALAAGVDMVLAAKSTVDLFSPKVVRAGMGAHFHLKLRWNQVWAQVATVVEGMQVLLASAEAGGQPYWQVDWRIPTALVIGGEAEGASREATRLATARVAIPMHGNVESLNASVAASILLFEAARQRSQLANQGVRAGAVT
jgi:TrmH family RNA methyltransferase